MFMRKGSVAREVFGDNFVDHFGGTREHEVMLWQEAVTDWYVYLSWVALLVESHFTKTVQLTRSFPGR
jgi:hypothetical protein